MCAEESLPAWCAQPSGASTRQGRVGRFFVLVFGQTNCRGTTVWCKLADDTPCLVRTLSQTERRKGKGILILFHFRVTTASLLNPWEWQSSEAIFHDYLNFWNAVDWVSIICAGPSPEEAFPHVHIRSASERGAASHFLRGELFD